ncbi:MAG: transglutaminase domain-containing protein [Bacteroidota bacterium]
MKLKITHQTTYRYSDKVFVEPQHLYFYPLPRNYLTLHNFELKIDPASSGLAQRIDAEDNLYHQCWFNDMQDKIIITALIEVESEEINPFNFLLEESAKTPHTKALDIFLEKEKLSGEAKNWTIELMEAGDDNLITFLTYLNKEINNNWDHETRYEADLMDPVTCFDLKRGSCRDLSWMMINILRNQNIPARFVSGYAFNAELGGGHELHAWIEAWVPGAGWVAFDPSAGLLATNSYIPVVSSYHPSNTFPVQGSYRGSAIADLTFDVKIIEIN